MADSINDIVAQTSAWLVDRISTEVESVHGNVVSVVREDELLQEAGRSSRPIIGVVYLGLQAVQTTTRQGSTQNVRPSTTQLADAVFELYVLNTQVARGGESEKFLDTLDLLDLCRQAILLQRPQETRQWRFILEQAADFGKHVAYRQRWTIRVPLV